MKTNYLLKSLAAMLLVFFVTNLSAKDISVKRNGTDSDLADALEQAEAGDVLIIDGMIVFDAPILIEKSVKFVGKAGDGSDFFYGQGLTQLFTIEPPEDEGGVVIFEQLGFAEAYNEGNGGAVLILGGTTEFLFCWFEDNYAADQGGAVFINNDETVVRFAGCSASGNVAKVKGGFLWASKADVSYEYCTITNNRVIDGRGSAFFLEGGDHHFFYTVISGNVAGTDMDDHGEGGTIASVNVRTITMESCAVVNNIGYDHGTAFFTMGAGANITLINTTVSNNYTKRGAGCWFLATDDLDLTLVNTIYADNKSDDNRGNGGGGIRVMNLNNRINVFNSIIIRNFCHFASPDNPEFGAVDFRFDGKPGIMNDLVFKNSIVGLLSNAPAEDIPAAQDNPDIAQKSLINMYRLGEEESQRDYAEFDESGVSFEKGLRTTKSFKMRYLALIDNTVAAAKLGDPALLGEYDRTDFDQLLVPRTVTGGAIFAGPVQGVLEGEDYDDTGWEDQIESIYGEGTGIKTLPAKKADIRIIGVAANGILGVDFGDLKGRAKGTLINIAGQEVEKVFDLYVNSKGYYNIHAAPGMYILKVEIGGETYAKKLIVK